MGCVRVMRNDGLCSSGEFAVEAVGVAVGVLAEHSPKEECGVLVEHQCKSKIALLATCLKTNSIELEKCMDVARNPAILFDPNDVML